MDTTNELRKKELICELQKVKFCSVPTVQTFDMGLQYDYICSEGAGTGLGNILSWPAYRIRKIGDEQWSIIQSKISNSTLSMKDLTATDLFALAEIFTQANCVKYHNLADLFNDLCDFPKRLSGDFFCLFDDVSWAWRPEFYSSEKEFLCRFEDKYCGGHVAWEDMGLEELEDWLSRSQDDLSEFPCNTLHDEIEQ